MQAELARREGRLDEAESLLRTELRQRIATDGDASPGAQAVALQLADLLESRSQKSEAQELRKAARAVAGPSGG